MEGAEQVWVLWITQGAVQQGATEMWEYSQENQAKPGNCHLHCLTEALRAPSSPQQFPAWIFPVCQDGSEEEMLSHAPISQQIGSIRSKVFPFQVLLPAVTRTLFLVP